MHHEAVSDRDSGNAAVRGDPPTDSSTFRSLQVPAYRTLFTSSIGIFLAVMSQAIARGWVAFDLTGTNTGLGGVMLGFGLAMLVATPWGGVIADRGDKRLILALCIAGLLLTSAWIGLAIVTGWIAYWMLVAASALQAVAFAVYGPTRMALTAELVGPTALSNAITLAQVSTEGTRVIGPAAAGVLIGVPWFGAGGVFLAGAVLCGMSIVMTLRIPKPVRRVNSGRAPLRELADAVSYLRADRRLSLISVTSLGVVIAGMPYLTFLPVLAEGVHEAGPSGYGIMSAVSAVGAVAAGLLAARASDASAWMRIGGAGAAFGTALIATAAAPTFWAALVPLTIIGGAALMFQTASQATLITLSEPRFHGRVQATVMLGYSGFGLAALPLGVLADAVGLRATLAAMGSVVLVASAGFAIGHRLVITRELVGTAPETEIIT